MAVRAPDVEGACIAVLSGAGIDASDLLTPPYPSVRVLRVGGTRATILDAAQVQLDVANGADGSKSATLTRLEECITALRAAEGQSIAGVVLTAVEISGGPAYLPDPATGAPRYVATLNVYSRAAVPQIA